MDSSRQSCSSGARSLFGADCSLLPVLNLRRQPADSRNCARIDTVAHPPLLVRAFFGPLDGNAISNCGMCDGIDRGAACAGPSRRWGALRPRASVTASGRKCPGLRAAQFHCSLSCCRQDGRGFDGRDRTCHVPLPYEQRRKRMAQLGRVIDELQRQSLALGEDASDQPPEVVLGVRVAEIKASRARTAGICEDC